MAVDKYGILLCMFSCLCCVICDLNLNEDSPCLTNGLNGTCVRITRCGSAKLTYLYANAGFDMEENELPALPDICSYKNKEPVVCCTDCWIARKSDHDSAIKPNGDIVSKKGPVSWSKCLDYFKNLPYPCRGHVKIKVSKTWIEDQKCHGYSHGASLGGGSGGGGVGGRDAQRWEFPHMALLGFGDDVESAQWLCGGSVISERFIVTAAHCTFTNALGNVSLAALGLLKRSDPKKYWKVYKIKRIIFHPQYKSPSKYHDIALLETETEIRFGKDLLPACLDRGLEPEQVAEAPGWGRLGYRQSLADTLQVVYVHDFEESDCARIYQVHRHLKHGFDHEKQMCYGSHTEIVDTCEGDSGGPLQTNQMHCLYTIVGVTSYGKDCGILGSAGMYTRVSYYVPWIESVVWPEETEARRKLDDQWLHMPMDTWLKLFQSFE